MEQLRPKMKSYGELEEETTMCAVNNHKQINSLKMECGHFVCKKCIPSHGHVFCSRCKKRNFMNIYDNEVDLDGPSMAPDGPDTASDDQDDTDDPSVADFGMAGRLHDASDAQQMASNPLDKLETVIRPLIEPGKNPLNHLKTLDFPPVPTTSLSIAASKETLDAQLNQIRNSSENKKSFTNESRTLEPA